MTTRADQHDIDKLARWHRDLTAVPHSPFPVYAIFLVSADDRLAHDIFRKFRASFETRNAGFANLVIFGQHGVSSTVRSLLAEFGMSPEALPSLASVASPDAACAYSLSLPPGDGDVLDTGQQEELWQTLLARVEAAADKGNRVLELDSVAGMVRRQIRQGTLVKLVARLMADLS